MFILFCLGDLFCGDAVVMMVVATLSMTRMLFVPSATVVVFRTVMVTFVTARLLGRSLLS
jgi:hypothetical protein